MAHMHFQIPFEEQKTMTNKQRCKSAHAKIDLWGKNIQNQTWYTQQQNSLANFPQKTWKKLIIVVQPRSPRRRRRRRAVISRLPPIGAQSSIYARASHKSSFLLSLTLSGFAVGYSDSRARGQRNGASSSHCASDGWFFSGSSPAGQFFLSPVLSHWEELRAWIILLAVFSRYYWRFLLWFHSCKPVGVEVIVWFADQCVARLRESATSCAFGYEPLSWRRRQR